MVKKTIKLWRLPLILSLFTVFGSAMLMAGFYLTEDKIAEQNKLRILNSLSRLVPDSAHDNDLLSDAVEIFEPEQLGHRKPMTLYRGYLNGTLNALAVPVIARDGYSGDISLMVGISKNGRITAVDIISHQETPGLGDYIERSKSDWIHQFSNKSLNNPEEKQWTVKKNGGYYDQITGATITPRAVVHGVKKSLIYAQEQLL